MQRYDQMFSRLTAANQGAFVPFVTLGDPTAELSFDIIKTLVDNGADALELGIPFSDPIADGPTIQGANIRALAAGVNLRTIQRIEKEASASLQTKKALAAAFDIPISDLEPQEILKMKKYEYKTLEIQSKEGFLSGLKKQELPDFEAILSISSIKMIPLFSANRIASSFTSSKSINLDISSSRSTFRASAIVSFRFLVFLGIIPEIMS